MLAASESTPLAHTHTHLSA